jgi:trigger factor
VQILEEKKLENATVEMVIEGPQNRIDVEYKSVFDKIAKNAKIDGFRRGKAPLKLIENVYRQQAEQEVLENILKSTYVDAVQEKSHSPVGNPSFDFKEFDRSKPFTYSVKFEVMPTIELGPYREIEAKERTCEIKEKDIDKEIDDLRERSAKISKKEDGAVVEKGNVLRFGIKRIDNVTPGEAANLAFKEYNIIVGKSTSEYAVDKFVTGMKVGDTKEVDIKYPKDYEVKDLAGQKVKYLVKAEEISKMELPAADDEFAKDVSEFQNIQDLRQNIRQTLEKYVADTTRAEVAEELIREIIGKSTFDIPESMIQKEMQSILERIIKRTGTQVKNAEEFAAMMGMNVDELNARVKEEALVDIKSFMARLEIAKKENISFSEEEYNNMIQAIAVQSGKPVEEMKMAIEQSRTRESVETELILINARKFIYDNAKIKKLKPVSFDEFYKKKQS